MDSRGLADTSTVQAIHRLSAGQLQAIAELTGSQITLASLITIFPDASSNVTAPTASAAAAVTTAQSRQFGGR
jgi:hypothetical protein